MAHHACKPTSSYLPGGVVHQQGKSGQIQLLKAIAEAFKDCVPPHERWRIEEITKPFPNTKHGYTFASDQNAEAWAVTIAFWTADREDLDDYHEKKLFFSSDMAMGSIFASPDLHLGYWLSGRFPTSYLEATLGRV